MLTNPAIRYRRHNTNASSLHLVLVAISLLGFSSLTMGAEEAESPDTVNEFSAAQIEFFEKKVRPLLVERCIDCHNEDLGEGGLDLSSRAAILKGGDSGSAFNFKHAGESLLLEAISYKPDAIVEMPPDGRLEAEEVAAITKWVNEGLAWPGAQPTPPDEAVDEDSEYPFTEEQLAHWSFQPLTKPAVPDVAQTDWPRNEIDNFILSDLEAASMQPAPRADKLTLIRRATFDLTGLPPTPEEIEAFLSDESDDAFNKVVERLLNSKAYGERWGRHWLDVARYADTNGMDENLSYANAFRYRNYVIDSFNKDKPYDQFLQEQLAGDLMPVDGDEQATIERQIATGFLAIGPKMLAEDDPVKMHMDIIDEQLDTTGKAFLAMSMGCARCHDHKFDPITTKDYYSLAGIFKSTKTMENFKVVADWYRRPVEPQARIDAWNTYEKNKAAEQKAIDGIVAEANSNFQKTARNRAADYLAAATDALYTRSEHLERADQWNSGETPADVGLEKLAEKFDRGNVDVQEQKADPRLAVILTYNRGKSSAEYDFEVTTAGQYALYVRYAAHQSRPLKISLNDTVVKEAGVNQTTGSWGPDGQRWFFEQVVHLQQGTNVVKLSCDTLFPHVSQIRLIPVDSSVDAVADNPNETGEGLDALVLEQWISFLKEELKNQNSILRPWFALEDNLNTATSGSKYKRLNDVVRNNHQHARRELRQQYAALFTEAQQAWDTLKANEETKGQKSLADAELEAARMIVLGDKGPLRIPDNVEQAYPAEVQQQLAVHRESLKQIEDQAPEPLMYAMGVTESDVENMHVCIRGNHINLGEEVPRRFLTVIEGPEQKPLDDDRSGRLELARWMTKSDHPLTSRVMANRIWRWHTGTGLVRTPDNFGLTGEEPTHPQLLDWLAVSFVERGWSIKEMHRLIMNSATWQMSSQYSPEYVETDPENKKYWRMNRHRLEAEAIRDSILAIAGTLDAQKVDTTLKYKSHEYVNSTGGAGAVSYDLNYRSVYLPIIRSALYEMFQAYDFPDPSYMQGNRATTTIAPQALFLMNSDFVDQHTEAMGRRLLNEASDSAEGRIERAYQLVFGRSPESGELEDSLSFVYGYEEQVVAAIPEPEQRELQVWKGFCRVLLSSNEFIFVD